MDTVLTKKEIQKQIIDRVVKHLSSLGNDMYYTSTADLCQEIKHIIEAKKLLSKEDTDMVSNLRVNDILSLLSFNSNCC